MLSARVKASERSHTKGFDSCEGEHLGIPGRVAQGHITKPARAAGVRHEKVSPENSALVSSCSVAGDFIKTDIFAGLAGGAKIDVPIVVGKGAGVIEPCASLHPPEGIIGQSS